MPSACWCRLRWLLLRPGCHAAPDAPRKVQSRRQLRRGHSPILVLRMLHHYSTRQGGRAPRGAPPPGQRRHAVQGQHWWYDIPGPVNAAVNLYQEHWGDIFGLSFPFSTIFLAKGLPLYTRVELLISLVSGGLSCRHTLRSLIITKHSFVCIT